MPSIPIPIRGAKEPVDSRRPYLKPSTKEEKKGRKTKARKRESRKARKSQRKRRYAKRRAVKALRGTWFLVKWVPKIIKILPKRLPKRHFKSKEELFVKTPA